MARSAVAAALALLAWLMFAVGLIAPLTPSDGRPAPGVVATFVGGPLTLLGLSALSARTAATRWLALGEAAAVVVLAWRLALG